MKKKMGLKIQSEDYLQQWWVYLKKSPGIFSYSVNLDDLFQPI